MKKQISTGPIKAKIGEPAGIHRRIGILYVDHEIYMRGGEAIREIFEKLKIIPVQVNTNLATRQVFVYFISPNLNPLPMGVRPPTFYLEIEQDEEGEIKDARLIEKDSGDPYMES